MSNSDRDKYRSSAKTPKQKVPYKTTPDEVLPKDLGASEVDDPWKDLETGVDMAVAPDETVEFYQEGMGSQTDITGNTADVVLTDEVDKL